MSPGKSRHFGRPVFPFLELLYIIVLKTVDLKKIPPQDIKATSEKWSILLGSNMDDTRSV